MISKMYAFDLDGTVTVEETLPLLAKEVGLYAEMELLTKLTMEGSIPFDKSFKLRFQVLNGIPVERIQDILANVQLDEEISCFIKKHKSECAIVTGNLDLWVCKLVERLGCKLYASHGSLAVNGMLTLDKVLHKSEAIREMKKEASKVIAVGESYNDVPMFEEADYSIAYGGVHPPVSKAINNADYVVFDGGKLCNILKML